MENTILDEYARLTDEKNALEQEITAIADELTSGPNPPGLKGPLVDADGFPRGDIDVYRVRHQRHAFAVKQNDHKAVMQRIEQMLPQYVSFSIALYAKRSWRMSTLLMQCVLVCVPTTECLKQKRRQREQQQVRVQQTRRQQHPHLQCQWLALHQQCRFVLRRMRQHLVRSVRCLSSDRRDCQTTERSCVRLLGLTRDCVCVWGDG